MDKCPSLIQVIIITKADKAPSDTTLAEMKENVKSVLDVKGIRYDDVLTFSRNKNCEFEKFGIGGDNE